MVLQLSLWYVKIFKTQYITNTILKYFLNYMKLLFISLNSTDFTQVSMPKICI